MSSDLRGEEELIGIRNNERESRDARLLDSSLDRMRTIRHEVGHGLLDQRTSTRNIVFQCNGSAKQAGSAMVEHCINDRRASASAREMGRSFTSTEAAARMPIIGPFR